MMKNPQTVDILFSRSLSRKQESLSQFLICGSCLHLTLSEVTKSGMEEESITLQSINVIHGQNLSSRWKKRDFEKRICSSILFPLNIVMSCSIYLMAYLLFPTSYSHE